MDALELDPAAIAAQLDPPLLVIDVGCRAPMPVAWNWFAGHFSLIGFDPDEDECERLRRLWSGPGPARFEPIALGARRERRRLHVTADPSCSSFFAPVPSIWEHYPVLAPLRPVATAEVDVVDLDSWRASQHVPPPDVIKLDVQGAELEVLQGASATMPKVRAADIEVAFAPMYENQPLFGDIDSFMRAHGFVLWRLTQLVHYTAADLPGGQPFYDEQFGDSVPSGFRAPPGRLFWGEARYVHRRTLDTSRSRPQRLRDAAAFAAVALHDLSLATVRAVAPELITLPRRRSLPRRAVGRMLRTAGLRRRPRH